jgi:hypothetical protein
VKNTKRILEVKIIREVDSDPDTSYYGEYANRANSEFSIDRAHELDCAAQIGNPQTAQAKKTLEHIQQTIGDMQAALNENDFESEDECSNEWDALEDAYNKVDELFDAASDCDCGYSGQWNRREYRYFNPSDNYKGEPAEEVRKYVRQDFERMESYNRGHWCYVGVYATAAVTIGDSVQTIRSGGLWGNESDSDRSHFEEVEAEQLSELRGTLRMLGFSARAISQAFKNVEREDA